MQAGIPPVAVGSAAIPLPAIATTPLRGAGREETSATLQKDKIPLFILETFSSCADGSCSIFMDNNTRNIYSPPGNNEFEDGKTEENWVLDQVDCFYPPLKEGKSVVFERTQNSSGGGGAGTWWSSD